MAFGRKKVPIVEEAPVVVDDSAWMLENPISEFLLMHTIEIKFMCLVGYCFFGGVKVFSTSKPDHSIAYKFINLIFTCTGGGIFIPIFLNKIPVPLADDYYVMAIIISFAIHYYFPIVRKVYKLSPIFQTFITVMFETVRTFVVCKLTGLGASEISPSAFSISLFGPIMCGAVGGCGGAFLPLNKGLDPVAKGLAVPMLTAFLAAAGFHLYLNTSLSDGCIDARDKARVHVGLFFISTALINNFGFFKTESPAPVVKAEGKKSN